MAFFGKSWTGPWSGIVLYFDLRLDFDGTINPLANSEHYFLLLFQKSIINDFRDLRQTAEEAGWFKVQPLFFILHLAHILALEAAGYLVISYFGLSWIPYLIATALIVIAQVLFFLNN